MAYVCDLLLPPHSYICTILPEEEQMDRHDDAASGDVRAEPLPYPTELPHEAAETGSPLESALVGLPSGTPHT